MNRFLHYFCPIIFAFSFGFIFGSEFSNKEMKRLINENKNLLNILYKINIEPQNTMNEPLDVMSDYDDGDIHI